MAGYHFISRLSSNYRNCWFILWLNNGFIKFSNVRIYGQLILCLIFQHPSRIWCVIISTYCLIMSLYFRVLFACFIHYHLLFCVIDWLGCCQVNIYLVLFSVSPLVLICAGCVPYFYSVYFVAVDFHWIATLKHLILLLYNKIIATVKSETLNADKCMIHDKHLVLGCQIPARMSEKKYTASLSTEDTGHLEKYEKKRKG